MKCVHRSRTNGAVNTHHASGAERQRGPTGLKHRSGGGRSGRRSPSRAPPPPPAPVAGAAWETAPFSLINTVQDVAGTQPRDPSPPFSIHLCASSPGMARSPFDKECDVRGAFASVVPHRTDPLASLVAAGERMGMGTAGPGWEATQRTARSSFGSSATATGGLAPPPADGTARDRRAQESVRWDKNWSHLVGREPEKNNCPTKSDQSKDPEWHGGWGVGIQPRPVGAPGALGPPAPGGGSLMRAREMSPAGLWLSSSPALTVGFRRWR